MANVVRFDCFEADLASCELRKHGVKLNLRGQSFQVLTTLLERHGEVVTREELRHRLWPDQVFIDFENSLNTAVARLREVLSDSANGPRYIETLPNHGYRFIADIETPAAAVETHGNRSRMVVLPFVNLCGHPEKEYFGDAMTDEIITALASLAPERLAVIARTTAMHYKGTHKDIGRIARELGVDYVVEGSLRLGDDQVTVNVQLIQTSDQTHLFAAKHETSLHNIFHLQSTIARSIATHTPCLTNEMCKVPIFMKPTEDLVAYTEYIKGRCEMWKGTPAGMALAKQHFERALAHDHGFALACDGLANLHWYLGYWGYLPPDQAEPIRRFYALRAIELDPNLIETRCLSAFHPERCNYGEAYSYNWTETAEEMARARDLNPNSPEIRIRYASVLMVLGRNDEASKELEHALEFDPLSIEGRFWLAEACLFSRHYDRALEQALRLSDFEPHHPLAQMLLGHVYLGMQRFEDSIAALHSAVEITREFPLMLGWLALSLGMGGYSSEARNILHRLNEISRNGFVLPTSFAWVHLGLGERDAAFQWMHIAAERIDGWIAALKSYPFLDPLRDDPRFKALLHKLNLEA